MRQRRSRAGTLSAATIATIVVGIVLGGCAQSDGSTTLESPPKNRARLALPTDAYVDTESAKREHAENLLINRCMRDEGFSWVAPSSGLAVDGNRSWNPVGRLLFTVETATRFGYHQQIGGGGLNDDQIAALFADPDLTAEARNRWDVCLRHAREAIGALPSQLATALAADAYDATLQDSRVVAAERRWHACMTPVGVADQPAAPTGMPSESVQKLADLDRDASPPTERPSHEERRIAIADARCRESSGYAATAYDIEYAHQGRLVNENAHELGDVRRQLDALHRRVNAIVVREEP